MVLADLLAGTIYGDLRTGEYVYLPAGEVGVSEPLCVLETSTNRVDISLEQAVKEITRRSLNPVCHPVLGRKAY